MTQPRIALGIVGGGGWLGSALAIAALDAGLVDGNSLTLSSRSGSGRNPRLSVARWTHDNQALVDACDLVVVSVRPEQFGDLRLEIRHKTVVSLMAGVSVRTLVDRLGTSRVVRAMPNAAAEIRRSYTPWYATPGVPLEDRAFVRALFECCGMVDEVASEAQIDYLTGLTGTGPAFPALLASAMLQDAIALGIDPGIARRAVEAVVVGASQLVEGRMPEEILQTLIGYRGVTAAAIEAASKAGFGDAVRAGMRAALVRVEGMSRQNRGPMFEADVSGSEGAGPAEIRTD